MIIAKNFDISNLHTFRLNSTSEAFAEPQSRDDLMVAVRWAKKANLSVFVLGGGSNLTPSHRVKGLVIRPALSGYQILSETEQTVVVRVESSENWHSFVMATVENGWYGIENLALIPGTVGASPIQNIGAYGVEIKSVVTEVEILRFETGAFETYNNHECHFAYRDSAFKVKGENWGCITSVTMKLSKIPKFEIRYSELARHFAERAPRSSLEVAEVVSEIRRSKLPDPQHHPNSGSFFKNPVVDKKLAEKLLQEFPTLPTYPTYQADEVKLAAGWMIDQCGWKGRSIGPVGCYPTQALCLYNLGTATFKDLQIAEAMIKDDVFKKFGVNLEREPIIW